MGTSQQFSLRWNNYLRHITCAFDSLRSDEDLVDVTLSCEGKRIRAHKMLLSACSTYFRDLFKVSVWVSERCYFTKLNRINFSYFFVLLLLVSYCILLWVVCMCVWCTVVLSAFTVCISLHRTSVMLCCGKGEVPEHVKKAYGKWKCSFFSLTVSQSLH